MAVVIANPEIEELVEELIGPPRTGRPGYPVRALLHLVLVRSIFAQTSWRATVQLVTEDADLAATLGLDPGTDEVPSVWACYRFARRLRAQIGRVDACGLRLAAAARAEIEDCGRRTMLETLDIEAFTYGGQEGIRNGGLTSRCSHPQAGHGDRARPTRVRWPRAGNGFRSERRGRLHGYQLHAVVCLETGLPLDWRFARAGVKSRRAAIDLMRSTPTTVVEEWPHPTRLGLTLPTAIGRDPLRRCVPFGTRGKQAANVLVSASILAQLAFAVGVSRNAFRAPARAPVR